MLGFLNSAGEDKSSSTVRESKLKTYYFPFFFGRRVRLGTSYVTTLGILTFERFISAYEKLCLEKNYIFICFSV